jgi:hypothetical protein
LTTWDGNPNAIRGPRSGQLALVGVEYLQLVITEKASSTAADLERHVHRNQQPLSQNTAAEPMFLTGIPAKAAVLFACTVLTAATAPNLYF